MNFVFKAQASVNGTIPERRCPRRSNGAVSRAAGCTVSIHCWIFGIICHSWVFKWSWFTDGSGVIRWLGLQHHAMTSHTLILHFDSLTRTLLFFYLELGGKLLVYSTSCIWFMQLLFLEPPAECLGGMQKHRTYGLRFLLFCKWDHQCIPSAQTSETYSKQNLRGWDYRCLQAVYQAGINSLQDKVAWINQSWVLQGNIRRSSRTISSASIAGAGWERSVKSDFIQPCLLRWADRSGVGMFRVKWCFLHAAAGINTPR